MRPETLLLVSSLLWSTGGLFIKLVDWNPLAIAGGRSIFAAATIWLLLPRHRVRWTRLSIGGAIAYSATVMTFVMATKWTTAANAIFLQFTAPVYVAVFGARFLGEKVSSADWARMAVAQGGILLFFLDGLSWTGARGNAMGLVSGVCFAAMIVLLRKQKDANPVDSVLLGNMLTVMIAFPAMLGPLPSVKSLLTLMFLGTVQLGLAYFLYARAIKHVPALTAILIGMIEPVLNPLWVLLVLREIPNWPALAGGSLVVGAALAQGLAAARGNRLPPPPLPPD